MSRSLSTSRRCRGVTLLELLVFGALWTLLAVATMRVIGETRVLRANARTRTALTLIAQGELDRMRLAPTAELKTGQTIVRRDDWPSSVTAAVAVSRLPDGPWLIDVRVERPSIDGFKPVELATLRTGGAQ